TTPWQFANSYFFFSSRRRHTRFSRDWSSDVCSSDLLNFGQLPKRKTGNRLNFGLRFWDKNIVSFHKHSKKINNLRSNQIGFFRSNAYWKRNPRHYHLCGKSLQFG